MHEADNDGEPQAIEAHACPCGARSSFCAVCSRASETNVDDEDVAAALELVLAQRTSGSKVARVDGEREMVLDPAESILRPSENSSTSWTHVAGPMSEAATPLTITTDALTSCAPRASGIDAAAGTLPRTPRRLERPGSDRELDQTAHHEQTEEVNPWECS